MLPDGVKSLAEISDYPDAAVRVPLLTTLLEYLLKYVTPSGDYGTLGNLIERHSKRFVNIRAVEDARWTRNKLLHGRRVTRAQINEAEVSLEDAIHDVLKSSDLPERLRVQVTGFPTSPSPHGTNEAATTALGHESGLRPISSAPPPAKAPTSRPPVATPVARVTPLIRTPAEIGKAERLSAASKLEKGDSTALDASQLSSLGPGMQKTPGTTATTVAPQSLPPPSHSLSSGPVMPKTPTVPKKTTPDLSPRKLGPPVAAPAEAVPPPVWTQTKPIVPKSAATPQEPPDRKKVHINALAHELEVTAREILERLTELGIIGTLTYTSSISDDIAAKLRRLYGHFFCPVCDVPVHLVDFDRGDPVFCHGGDDVVCSSCSSHLVVVGTEGDFELVVLKDDQDEYSDGSDETDFGIGGP